MFLGHLPAGYLATSALLDRARPAAPLRRRLLALGLVASVLPDVDLFWFYGVSDRTVVHHAFWPHLPGVWLLLAVVAALAFRVAGASREAWLALGVVLGNVALHLLLDTVAGGIRWGWPFTTAELRLTTVPARHHPWYLNFLLHWTFALELALVAAAGWQLRRRRTVGW